MTTVKRGGLTVVGEPNSRFEVHRREAVRRAELELASALTRSAADTATRAAALFATASGDTDHRTQAVGEALTSLRAAHLALAEVLAEFDR
jgi:hypothetical protein